MSIGEIIKDKNKKSPYWHYKLTIAILISISILNMLDCFYSWYSNAFFLYLQGGISFILIGASMILYGRWAHEEFVFSDSATLAKITGMIIIVLTILIILWSYLTIGCVVT